MARVLDTASVRVELDVRQAERDAKRAGETAGRAYAKGADREAQRNPIRPKIDPIEADFERQVRAAISKISKTANVNVPFTVKGEELRARAKAAISEIERTMSAKIPTDPAGALEYRRKLARLVREAGRTVHSNVKLNVDVDRNRITQSLASVASMFGRFGEKVSSVSSTVVGPVNKALGAFNLSLSGVVTALIAATLAAPPVAAAISVIGGAAVSAFGAISAGVIGLPALLTTIVAPLAAITLGMDGIKRAAAPLRDEFNLLKTVLNTTFELTMRPVFEKLQAIFPTLTAGLSETARAVSRVAMDFAGILTTPSGIENIRVALAGVSNAIDGMRPGLQALFQALLNVAGTRELYDILGQTIGGVAERFAAMIEQVRSSGDLAGALDQLRGILFSVTDLLTLLAQGAIKFFRAAGPGLKSFFDSLVATLSKVNWKSLGESFGGLMERLGNAIQAVPPEEWQKLGDAIGKLTERFTQWTESGGIEGFITGISAAATILSFFAGNWLKVISAGKGFMDFIGGIPSALSGVTGSVGSALSGIGGSVTENFGTVPASIGTTLAQVPSEVTTTFGGIPGMISGFLSQSAASVTDGLGSMTEATSQALGGFGVSLDGFFSNLPDRVGYWIGFTVTSMGLMIVNGVEAAAGFFAQLPGRLEAIAADMAQRVGAFFIALPGQLMTWTGQAVSAVVGVISALPGQVAAIVGSMVQRTVDFFASLPGKLASLASAALDAVVSAFSGLPARVGALVSKMVSDVIGFFKRLPGELLQAGKDAIQGFIDGVKQKAQSVVDAAKNVVSGAIRGAKDALRSGSPSLEFRDIGRDTIQGYIVGVREKIAPLLNQIQAVFAQAVTAAQSASGGLDFGLGALNVAGQVTAGAVGSATSTTADLPTLMDALSAVFNAAEWKIDGSDIALVANRGNLQLARR